MKQPTDAKTIGGPIASLGTYIDLELALSDLLGDRLRRTSTSAGSRVPGGAGHDRKCCRTREDAPSRPRPRPPVPKRRARAPGSRTHCHDAPSTERPMSRAHTIQILPPPAPKRLDPMRRRPPPRAFGPS